MEHFSVETTPNHTAIVALERSIEGYMREESAAIWCWLLKLQHDTWSWRGLSAGNYLEIGAFKGKSASVLASHSNAYGNRLSIVDPEIPQETRDRLDAITSNVEYLPMRSESISTDPIFRREHRNIAFAHIDGMHRFSAVQNDLRICEDMLSDFGIISVDDFHTDLYPQIPAAVYRYLYSGTSDLSIFLVGFNKAYLCRNTAKQIYKETVVRTATKELAAMGYKLSLVKTDRNDSFDAYSLVVWQGTASVGDAT